MYFVYNYAAASSQANILSDLCALITGTTDKTTLSAACVQANTTITSTVAAGWETFDSAAGTNERCLRALNQDGTTYKYWNLQLTSTTALGGKISESWNATTHTGTNTSSLSSTVWSSTGGGWFYGYVTPRNIIIISWTSAGYQVLQGLVVIEFSRDTVPSGYPCALMVNASSSIGGTSASAVIPKVKTANAAGDTNNTTAIALGALLASGSLNNTQLYRNAAETETMAFYKAGVAGTTAAVGQHHYGTNYAWYFSGGSAVSNLDEIAFGGKTYVALKGSAIPALWVPKE